MNEATWHLAQLNIARLMAPLDSPPVADFVAALDPVKRAGGLGNRLCVAPQPHSAIGPREGWVIGRPSAVVSAAYGPRLKTVMRRLCGSGTTIASSST